MTFRDHIEIIKGIIYPAIAIYCGLVLFAALAIALEPALFH